MEIFSPKGFSNSAGSGEECCDTPRTGEDQGCYPQTLKTPVSSRLGGRPTGSLEERLGKYLCTVL